MNEACPARNFSEVSNTGQVCSRGCLRNRDCWKRQCHCDGACGLSCVRKGRTCPWPVSVDNATVRLLGGNRPLFNHWLEVSCLPGFITQAGPTVSRHRCQGDQRWSGSMPECQAQQSPKQFCGPPPALTHGSYQVLDQSSDSFIRYKCNPGFVLKGPEVNSCGEDGFWTQQAPTCTAISCQPPPDIPQSHLVAVQRDSYPAGTRVYYLCRRGYRMVGSHKVTCDLQGEWTQLPTCQAPCSIPAHRDRMLYQGRRVWHSEIPGGKLHHGETLDFFCEDVDRGCSFLAQAVCTEGQLAIPSCYQ
ncbi:beta-2-glycoprotein 1-like, partial [Hypanus sabinus]